MSGRMLEPDFRYVFRLRDGETLIAAPRDAKRTLDRRNDSTPPETVWEVMVNGLVRRLWPEDIADWSLEDVTGATPGELRRADEGQEQGDV